MDLSFLTRRPNIPLVTILGRTFQMGTQVGGEDNERPVRQVTLSSYRISDLVPNKLFEMYETAHRESLLELKNNDLPESLCGILWHQPNGEVSVIARGIVEKEIELTGNRGISWRENFRTGAGTHAHGVKTIMGRMTQRI